MATVNRNAGHYFTAWSDGTRIDKEARIHWAASKPEMIERLQDCSGDLKVIDVEPGDFGDCYSKHVGMPDLERLAEAIPYATTDDFNVRAPGQHPGGSFYWVDFYPTVYVPVYAPEESADE
jgi:hypothetical protein